MHHVWAMLVSLVTNKLTLVLLLAPTVLSDATPRRDGLTAFLCQGIVSK